MSDVPKANSISSHADEESVERISVESEEEETFIEHEVDSDQADDSGQKALLEYFEGEGYEFESDSFNEPDEEESFSPIGKSDDLLGTNGFDLGIPPQPKQPRTQSRCYKTLTLILIYTGCALCLAVLVAIFSYGFHLWQTIDLSDPSWTSIMKPPETVIPLPPKPVPIPPCSPVEHQNHIELSRAIMQRYKQTKFAHCDKLREENSTLPDGAYSLKVKFGLMTLKFRAHCDMNTLGGGWTVIQRRGNYENPEDLFHKEFEEYVRGFGDEEGEYWLGLDLIKKMTDLEDHDLLVQIWSSSGNVGYALYEGFGLSDGPDFRLIVDSFAGNMNDSLSYSNDEPFSTLDRDRDRNKDINCSKLQSGGWWFRDCSQSNLNGLNGEIIDPALGQAMHWGELGRDPNAPIIKAEMKIRPSSSKMKRRQYHRYFSFEDNSNLLIS